ncbi:MAG: FAD-dependent monooxygenase [Cryomorphaceae bacterium]|nr:FAD-dependent monooxygenase [Cryomorphaceae bacterium]
MSDKKNTVIAGAGLVGSLLSIYLAKKGHNVQVFEKRPDARKTNVYAGRSINLALSDRGIRALEQAGIVDEVLKTAIPMYGRDIHNADGSRTYQSYGKDDQAIYSVSRGGLNNTLLDLAEQFTNIHINFEHGCETVDTSANTIVFNTPEGEAKTVTADLIFATDGAGSVIRRQMQSDGNVESKTQWIEHGYKELSIPANPDGSFKMEKNALHIWPRKDFMLIALPNPDGSFTLTLFLRNEGDVSFAALDNDEKVLEFFNREFSDAVPLMDDLLHDWHNNPTAPLGIVYTWPWVHNKTILLGDASHAIVPFYGQGMNSGFEDCYVFGEMLDQYSDWDALLDALQKSRKPDADAIAELAMRNFVEMRDLTGDPAFLLQKKIESRFAERHPDKWIPLYSRVTFSHERYHEALAKGKAQDALMKDVMAAIPNIADQWDSDEVEQAILARLETR